MKFFLAISSLSLALASTSPATAQQSLVDTLSQYVPDSVLSLLSESEILTAFSMSTSRETDAQKSVTDRLYRHQRRGTAHLLAVATRSRGRLCHR
ncbi:hypothetical protein CLG85_013820 [Yangia mangrovi]|uniref:Uncharacterized protein n=1 Tax=Alloyangia mangrovi TaxID=1779329 RepID=A0ABT2KPN8_9RHOB|nr:hypothetical protein [Alloyangia mangrovi]MCT4371337.1 hypothetical protein [Alloyangia mangrovi]